MKEIKREEVMECIMLVCDFKFDNNVLVENVLSNVCEEHDLDISDVFPHLQLMLSKETLIGYLFHQKARNETEQMILNEVKNQIIEYAEEDMLDFIDDVRTMYVEYGNGGNIREFLEQINILEMIKEL